MNKVIWAIDAGTVDIERSFDEFPLYRNSLINDFLNKDDKYVLLGPKGVGKTLLLKLKSWQYRKKGIKCYPKEQLCEIVMRGDTSFTEAEMKGFQNSEKWKIVWRLVLSVLALRSLKIDLNNYSGAFPYSRINDRLDSILGEVLTNRQKLASYDESFINYFAPAFSSIDQAFAAFLDRLDETLGKHTGGTLRRFEKESNYSDGHLSYNIWSSAQFGLMEAVRELREKNTHVKFFVTGRYEAFKLDQSATAHNLNAICIDLRYANWELREMFEIKLQALLKASPESFLSEDTIDLDLYKRFFGFSTYKHPRVSKVDGGFIEEHIFDCLLRHTRGSPRELEDIAREVGTLPPKERTKEQIRHIINNKSHEFFDFARGQALPYWFEEMDFFIKHIPANSMLRKELSRLKNKFKKQYPSQPLDSIEFLFRHGLIGYAINDEETGGELRQRFNINDPMAPAKIEELNASRYLFIHPCMDSYIESKNARYERNPWNIIGHGKIFSPVESMPHVHFGAGRIGCSLVLPLIKSRKDISLCIIQRPSKRWEALIQNKVFTTRIKIDNNEDTLVYDFLVISDLISEDCFKQYVKKWRHGEKDILIITSNSLRIQMLLRHTKSISTAVRQEPITDICTYIAAVDQNRSMAIFPFENDEQCFDLFRRELAGFPRIRVYDVVLDRLCPFQRIEKNEIYVMTEKHSTVYVMGEDHYSRLTQYALFRTLQGEKHGVKLINDYYINDFGYLRSTADFKFLHDSKRLLVNAIHFAAAIYGYSELLNSPTKIHPSLIISHIFQIIVRDPDIKEGISPIANYFCILILREYCQSLTKSNEEILESDLCSRAFYLKRLFSISWQRMRDMPDSLGRIIPNEIRKLTSKYYRFFGSIKPQQVKSVFLSRDDIKLLGVDVDESKVIISLSQLHSCYDRLLNSLPIE